MHIHENYYELLQSKQEYGIIMGMRAIDYRSFCKRKDDFMLTPANQNAVDAIVLNIPYGSTKTFGEISTLVFGHSYGAAAIGSYIFTQRVKNSYPYWRVTNRGSHPVADDFAIRKLVFEGHIIRNGKLFCGR